MNRYQILKTILKYKYFILCKITLKFITEKITLPQDSLLDANISTNDRNEDTLERVLLIAFLLFPSQA